MTGTGSINGWRRSAFMMIRGGLAAIAVLALGSCVTLTVSQKREYDNLMQAAADSAAIFRGDYKGALPKNIDEPKFLSTVRDKLPPNEFSLLKKYRLQIANEGNYYLLKIFDNRELILFDYSCTLEIDGAVLLQPGKFNLNTIGLYNKCTRLR